MKHLATSALSAVLLVAAGLLSAPPANAQTYDRLCVAFDSNGAFDYVSLSNDNTCPD